MTKLQPFYEQIQAHYDLSNDFYKLFLDPSMTYSCAYFERDDYTLQQAQLAKVDLALGKCDLRPGDLLLDVGCGWGGTIERAVEKYGVRAIGLTLSKAQHDYAKERLKRFGDRAEIRLQGWEEFDEPVDRIVSIGAFEHFREERYAAFFEKCYRLLPAQAAMLLHSIVFLDLDVIERNGLGPTVESVQFLKFLSKKIFPGGQLRPPAVVCRYAEAAGFRVTRRQSLQPHYARTLDTWAANLVAAREQAIALTSEEVFDTYMHYLTGCAKYFHSGHIDVMQFSLAKG
jgi:cyclopropane-fatty-acyl-phospholipid synthase